ncbi:hypothetical protein BD289DRAFT_113446 [Coniella lustricola]|uniref:Secreted protein n=1 Tax=Coniella lustricola TaxID=2025994 RepID=A0A2T3AGE1_9PEZI|nr:hypothetical protein BD289DRAFT_113446 [Coniella lustricola]
MWRWFGMGAWGFSFLFLLRLLPFLAVACLVCSYPFEMERHGAFCCLPVGSAPDAAFPRRRARRLGGSMEPVSLTEPRSMLQCLQRPRFTATCQACHSLCEKRPSFVAGYLPHVWSLYYSGTLLASEPYGPPEGLDPISATLPRSTSSTEPCSCSRLRGIHSSGKFASASANLHASYITFRVSHLISAESPFRNHISQRPTRTFTHLAVWSPCQSLGAIGDNALEPVAS